ncbi:hypothetical protein ACH5RR_008486 [Cinchona calisaya]|uniref:Uncharacterized protein n=1 Tax=Cinchona calisaya TaxID=153742 RepID=A0ABD3ABW2_9GENT
MIDKESIFETMPEFIRIWVQMLVNLFGTKWFSLPKSDALLHILSSKALSIKRNHQDYTHNKAETFSSTKSLGDETNFDTILYEITDSLKKLNLTCTPKLASQLEMNNNSFVSSQEYHLAKCETSTFFKRY